LIGRRGGLIAAGHITSYLSGMRALEGTFRWITDTKRRRPEFRCCKKAERTPKEVSENTGFRGADGSAAYLL
jgi:hypothetical protein